MLKRIQGLSMVEMMLIIGIIAFLTATAIPTYLKHLNNAKLGKARHYVSNINNTIANYYTDHGVFPTNAQIDIPSAIPASASQYLYAPNLAYVEIAPVTTTATQCPYGVSTSYFSNYDGDYFADNTSPYVVLKTFFIDRNGTLNKLCTFYEYNPATSQPTTNNVFPDCILTTDPDSSEIMTTINTACT